MRINKYIPFAILYFFFNSLGLPLGLTYTSILSPLLYIWVLRERKEEVLLPFVVCLFPFFIAQLINGVDEQSYLVSVVNYITVYIFIQAFYTFVKKAVHKERIFKILLIGNLLMCLLSLVIYFTPFHDWLWMQHTITDGADNVNRLKMFTYEASYYAVLFTPIFFFYFTQLLLQQNKINSWWLLLMLCLPYVLSFSIGAIGCIAIACFITYLIHFSALTIKKRVQTLFVLAILGFLFAFLFLWFLAPQNDLFIRIQNIIAGKDTSGKGRTSDAFILAMQILEQKNTLFGIGAGQIKILGADIIRSYYLYDLDYNDIAIPNATAETLAIFGFAGVTIRIGVELFLFYHTRVWRNYYRLFLFFFIFTYQFTGSFITNVAEYVIWVLAFTNAFPQFDVKRKNVLSEHYYKIVAV